MRRLIIAVAVVLCGFTANAELVYTSRDLSKPIVYSPASFSGPERKAVEMLLIEVEQRSGVRWEVTHEQPDPSRWVVAITNKDTALPGVDMPQPPEKPEGYALRINGGGVALCGRDARGVLFGVGRILRILSPTRDGFQFTGEHNISTAPDTPLRGHQLGYRPKTNSYDAWTVPMWEQYIRDLILFGTNAIELVPPRTDDAADSPHFPLPQHEMMKRMSQICADYGLDVWVWYPALDKDYTDTATVEFALKEWEEVLRDLPRLDALFVPGGDPGHSEPLVMMELLRKQAENLRKQRPQLQIWMSPQGFNKEWMDTFIHYMQTEQPEWLTGIVFGPQNRLQLNELRELLPKRYPIRHYPDITHTMQCQFPVPEWDYAFAITEQRECINPRPTQYKKIYDMFAPYTNGFITYSEGCNDDINKILWSAWGWDAELHPDDILADYFSYFLDQDWQAAKAGTFALERNWVGPLAKNDNVLETLAHWQEMERIASPQLLLNWRFQQLLYRAYYDAFIQHRLRSEEELEEAVLSRLYETAYRRGAVEAMKRAEAELAVATEVPVAQDLRARIFELGEALYQSIRMQLSVPKYKAIHPDRGANLDLIDLPLNNRLWLEAEFEKVRQLPEEADQLAAIREIVDWTNPGPGGYYDDLGDPANQPHLVMPEDRYVDPEFKTVPIMGREYAEGFRVSWNSYAETRYETPLQMRYDDLDGTAQYTVRVVYAGDSPEIKMRLEVDGVQVHDYIDKPWPPKPIEFSIPAEATTDGALMLSFTQPPGRGRNGRGCQVAEVWLLKNFTKAEQ